MKHLDLDFHLVGDQGVGGSNPLSPMILSLTLAAFSYVASTAGVAVDEVDFRISYRSDG